MNAEGDVWGPGWVQPLAAPTARTDRETLLDKAEEYADWLGIELWGWQRHVLSIALERENDRWARQRIVIQVCRQVGKSTLLTIRLLLGVMLAERIAVAAQRRSASAELWDHVTDLLLDRLPRQSIQLRRSIGAERLRVKTPHGQGDMSVVTASKTAARARTFDVLAIDEAAFVTPEFLAAIRPTRLTAKAPQFWFISSAGDESAVAWRQELAATHASDPDSVAVFRWGATPDDDWSSEDTWAAAIPTFGCDGGVQVEALREDWAALTPTAFAREYLSIGSSEKPAAIPLHDWQRCQGTLGPVPRGWHTRLAVDVAPDGSSAAIAAAWRDNSGKLCGTLLTSGDGDSWLQHKLLTLIRDHGPGAVVLDALCPARHMVPNLERAGHRVAVTQTWAYASSCTALAQACADGQITIESSEPLRLAHLSAIRRPLSRAWGIGRQEGGDPVQPLVALALAVGHLTGEPETGMLHLVDAG